MVKTESAIAFTRKKSSNKKHKNHYQWRWMVHKRFCTICSQLAKVRIILVPMIFARLSALNIVKTSKILVRILRFKFLKLISITIVFPATVILKLIKFHGIKGISNLHCNIVSTITWYSAVNQPNINLKALQIRWLEKNPHFAFI